MPVRTSLTESDTRANPAGREHRGAQRGTGRGVRADGEQTHEDLGCRGGKWGATAGCEQSRLTT